MSLIKRLHGPELKICTVSYTGDAPLSQVRNSNQQYHLTLKGQRRFRRQTADGSRVLGDVIGPGDVTHDQPMNSAVHYDVILLVGNYRFGALHPLDFDIGS